MDKQKLPYAFTEEGEQFTREVILAFCRRVEGERSKLVPPENVQVFQHGTGWTFQQEYNGGFTEQAGELEKHSVSSVLNIDRIAKNELSAIGDFIADMAKKFSDGFEKRMLEEMNATAEAAGNTFNIPKDGSLRNAMMELIKESHLSVGADGTVSRPTLHLEPKTFERFQKEFQNPDPEFTAAIEKLWAQKEHEAREREEERLARYEMPE